MAYKVKRGKNPTGGTLKEMLVSFARNLTFVLIIMSAIGAAGYFLLQFAYDTYPPFAKASDDVIYTVQSFYREHGLWTTAGMFLFICLCVWAFGEESRRRDDRREAMKEMMK